MTNDENNIFPILETDRLWLRELKLSDCHDFLEIFSSESVMKWYGMFPIDSMESAIKILENLRNTFPEGRGLRWAVVHKESGKFIGTCGFHNHNLMSRRAEIGYELSEAFWNQGFATEAIQAMLAFGQNYMNLHRIEALVYPENIASKKALVALGFEEEGLLRGYAYFRNRYQDLQMFSLINENHIRK